MVLTPSVSPDIMRGMKKVHLTNFRDLSGRKNKEGKRLKKGYLFRGRSLYGLNKKRLKEVEALHLDAIFDFRDEKDRIAKPDAKINGAHFYPCSVLEKLGPEASGSPVDIYYIQEVIAGKKMSKEEYEYSYELFMRMYREIPFAMEAFKPIFEALDRHERIYYHCTGGKDRTGIFSMILLWAFGFDDKAVYRDYHHSNYARWRKNLWRLAHIFLHSGQWMSIPYMWKYLDCNKKNFNITRSAIFDSYGDIETFLEKVHGVSKERIADWKAFYLEDSARLVSLKGKG